MDTNGFKHLSDRLDIELSDIDRSIKIYLKDDGTPKDNDQVFSNVKKLKDLIKIMRNLFQTIRYYDWSKFSDTIKDEGRRIGVHSELFILMAEREAFGTNLMELEALKDAERVMIDDMKSFIMSLDSEYWKEYRDMIFKYSTDNTHIDMEWIEKESSEFVKYLNGLVKQYEYLSSYLHELTVIHIDE